MLITVHTRFVCSILCPFIKMARPARGTKTAGRTILAAKPATILDDESCRQRQKPLPNYLKPTISFSCQHCSYPKHQQRSVTAAALAQNTPPLKSLNRAAPAAQPSRTQPRAKPSTQSSAASISQKSHLSAAKAVRSAPRTAKAVEISKGDHTGSLKTENDGTSDGSDGKGERSEAYWASEESMAGEESAGGRSVSHGLVVPISAPSELPKLQQRSDDFGSGGVQDEASEVTSPP